MLGLTPPKQVTFLISVAVALIAVILHYANIPIPNVTQSNFVTLLVAYLVLVAAVLLYAALCAFKVVRLEREVAALAHMSSEHGEEEEDRARAVS